MNKFLKSFLFALLTACCILGAVSADYYYRVPSLEVIYWIESDGSVSISYDYSVENTNSGDTIEYVDIGTPSNNFSLSDVEVYVNDTKITNGIKVTYADYSVTGLRYGITLEMGSYSVPAGASAKVYVIINGLQDTLYDATSETINEVETAYVGFDFAPNYFGSKYVEGKTDYTFQLVFPKGVTSETCYYYKPENWPGTDEPEAWIEDELVVYQWHAAEASAAKQYIFGAKFPSNVLTSTANINNEAAASSPDSSGGSSSGGFKETLGEILSCLTCLLPFGGIGFLIYKIAEKNKVKASKHYFPPQIKTDGEGIKRGLTAVEAAVLLEIDIDRVISMIIFGLAKKGAITIKSQDPFEVEITDPLPEGLYEYETNFIEALRETSEKKRTNRLRQSINRLILSTSKRIEGFSLKETKEYYKSICDKAWEQVEAADTDELKSQLLGEHFGWAMLTEEPEKKVETVFSGRTLYEPSWWWRYDPSYHRPAPMRPPRPAQPNVMPDTAETFTDSHTETSTSSDSDKGGSAMPVLPGAMFARSITDSARSLGTKLTGNTKDFQSQIRNTTNPVRTAPSDPSSRHRGGGGGGSSCACACACDSCACACAGGGR